MAKKRNYPTRTTRKTIRRFEKGKAGYDVGTLQDLLSALEQDLAGMGSDAGRPHQQAKLKSAIADLKSAIGDQPVSGTGTGPSTDTAGGDYGHNTPERGYTSTNPDKGYGTGDPQLDEFLAGLSDRGYTQLITGKHGPEKIFARMVEQAEEGRALGVEQFMGRQDAFDADPLVQALEGQATSLLEDPDVLSDEMIADLIGAEDARLSQSFQSEMGGLANQLGGRGIDPTDPVARELMAQGRFNTLQQGAIRETEIRTGAAQLNRSALENAMRLGLGTSAFTQGQRDQYTTNIANLLSGQPLAQVGPQAAATSAALNYDPGRTNPWQDLGMQMIGNVGDALTDPKTYFPQTFGGGG